MMRHQCCAVDVDSDQWLWLGFLMCWEVEDDDVATYIVRTENFKDFGVDRSSLSNLGVKKSLSTNQSLIQSCGVWGLLVVIGLSGVCGLLVVIGLSGVCGLLVVIGLSGMCDLLVAIGLSGVCGLLVVIGLSGMCDLLVAIGLSGVCGLLVVIGLSGVCDLLVAIGLSGVCGLSVAIDLSGLWPLSSAQSGTSTRSGTNTWPLSGMCENVRRS
ncbi:hypothetical protein LR48_Vigan11g096800 [Vigna angularis]|uniref:Uncharacterized protein n=1 Tax=Phaseolus angularis TaxID=3914 RepID=A0A0L9VS98_PHAAN|nr:hypothetical protein LR48_Vigan11g096800 [Vigna angularis]